MAAFHVSSYDTNIDEWTHEPPTAATPPIAIWPVHALEWLCESNKDSDQPLGPVRFQHTSERFVMVSNWTRGRALFQVVTVFSAHKLPDAELEAILTSEGV